MPGLVLYGPPAAGKDTITTALHELDQCYQLYPRIKVGNGRTAGYRMATEAEVNEHRHAGEVIWENHRYGSTYIVDRPYLDWMLHHCIPVIHLGQVEAVQEITEAFPDTEWLTVYLWCPRDIAATRIADRSTGDTQDRLRAWDATEDLPDAGLFLDTSQVTPQQAALRIHHAVSDLMPVYP